MLAPFRSTQCSGFWPFSRNPRESWIVEGGLWFQFSRALNHLWVLKRTLKNRRRASVRTTFDTTQFFLKISTTVRLNTKQSSTSKSDLNLFNGIPFHFYAPVLLYLPVFFPSFRQPCFVQGPLLHHTDGCVTQLKRFNQDKNVNWIELRLIPVCLSLSGRTFGEGCLSLYEAPPLPWP